MTEKRMEEQLERLIELQLDTTRLLAIALARDVETQAQLAVEMSEAGFENPRISQILNAPPSSVRNAVNAAKKARGG
ncbi:MAG: hypothetical protein V3V29_03745 [Acidimicrobiia bacterium]